MTVDLKQLKYVQRIRHGQWFNAHQRVVPMSIAEHSYMTAAITYFLCRESGSPNAEELVVAALFHDVEEGMTGDVSALMKRLVPDLRGKWNVAREMTMLEIIAPNDEDLRRKWAVKHPLIKAADIFSMWLYAAEEVEMGNRLMKSVCAVAQHWIADLAGVHEEMDPDLEDAPLVRWYLMFASENLRLEITDDDVPREIARFAFGVSDSAGVAGSGGRRPTANTTGHADHHQLLGQSFARESSSTGREPPASDR